MIIKPSLLLPTLWLGFVWACTSKDTTFEETDTESLRKQNEATLVEVAFAGRKPFEYEIQAKGQLVATREAALTFKTNGWLKALYVYPGMHVPKGQLMALQDDREVSLALEKAKIELKERQLEYENQLLATGQRADSAQWETLKTNLEYVTGLRKARLSHKEALWQLQQTRLKAPFKGVVTNLETKQGARVKKGDVFCLLSDPASLVVETELLETFSAQIKPGLKADFKPMGSESVFNGHIKSINPRVNKHGLVKLSIALGNSKGLMPGMHGAVRIYVPFHKNIIIPETALVVRSGKEVVFVAEQGLAKWKYVTTGLKSQNQVEILEGLTEGDTVITTNNIYLAHDAPVSITTNKTN